MIPGAPPDWPAAADIRPGTHSAGTALARYPNAASFVSMLRTGKRPDGTPIQVMPFESLGQLSDVDAQALYLYLNAPPGSVKQEVGSTAAGGQKSSANTVPSGPGGLKLPGRPRRLLAALQQGRHGDSGQERAKDSARSK